MIYLPSSMKDKESYNFIGLEAMVKSTLSALISTCARARACAHAHTHRHKYLFVYLTYHNVVIICFSNCTFKHENTKSVSMCLCPLWHSNGRYIHCVWTNPISSHCHTRIHKYSKGTFVVWGISFGFKVFLFKLLCLTSIRHVFKWNVQFSDWA